MINETLFAHRRLRCRGLGGAANIALCALLVCTALGTSGNARAQGIPATLSYSGSLERGGLPVDTTGSATFALFDAESGGTALWTETQASVSVRGGLFSVALGRVTALPLTAFASARRGSR